MTQRVAFVTGAGSGIGAATAQRLAQRHCTVYAGGRTQPSLSQAVDPNSDGGIHPICVDVTDAAGLRLATAHIASLDILVVNAGICERASISDMEADDVWSRVIETNLTGAWNTIRVLGEKLHNGASIVAVSSGLGKLGRAGYTAYAASKHGLLGMVKCLALEFAHRQITVNAVCPGWVDTQMAQSDLTVAAARHHTSVEVEFEKARSGIPLGRFVRPTEVAELIAWLCRSESRAITGQSYNISGGEFGL